MNTRQQKAAQQIIQNFIEQIEELGSMPNETYTHPGSGKEVQNSVWVDVKLMKMLADMPLEGE